MFSACFSFFFNQIRSQILVHQKKNVIKLWQHYNHNNKLLLIKLIFLVHFPMDTTPQLTICLNLIFSFNLLKFKFSFFAFIIFPIPKDCKHGFVWNFKQKVANVIIT